MAQVLGGGYPQVPVEYRRSTTRPGGPGLCAVKAAVRINPRAGTLGSTRHEDSARREGKPDAAGQQWGLPEVRGADGGWQRYVPAKKTVVAIGPGGGTRMNHEAYAALARLGYDVVPVHAAEYDDAADGSGYAYPPGWEDGQPDLAYNRGRNLATLADHVVLPLIRRLVKEGRGPACVIAGSRGGQVTVPRLWECGWRGPTLVINGGCAATSQIPPLPVRLLLVTGGRDFFPTQDPRYTKQILEKQDVRVPVLLYHDPDEGHMPFRLDRVFAGLLELFDEPCYPLWGEKEKDDDDDDGAAAASLAARVRARCPGRAEFSLL